MNVPEKTSNPTPEAVREAKVGDAEAVHALAGELAEALGDRRPRLEAIRERLRELVEERRARVLVAEGEDGIVGAASLWIKPDLGHGDTVIEVPMLVVSERARRRGVGRLLVQEIRGVAAAENVSLIELVATHENRAARDFYRSLGFVETDHVALEYFGEMEKVPEKE